MCNAGALLVRAGSAGKGKAAYTAVTEVKYAPKEANGFRESKSQTDVLFVTSTRTICLSQRNSVNYIQLISITTIGFLPARPPGHFPPFSSSVVVDPTACPAVPARHVQKIQNKTVFGCTAFMK